MKRVHSSITCFRKVLAYLGYLLLILATLTAACMLFFNEHIVGWHKWAVLGVFGFVAGYTLLRFIHMRRLRYLLILFIALGAVGIIDSQQTPSNDRVWRSDMTQLAQIQFLDADRLNIKNYRHFTHYSRTEHSANYVEREIRLSAIQSVDFYVSYWMPGAIAHTFVSFNLSDNQPPVTISIEARYEEHENFDPFASLFKEFEIIYIVGDEEDIVKVRTHYRNETVYRYPLQISAHTAQQLFLTYAERINHLNEEPEFYHLLSNNCTVNIARYANRVGRTGGFDIRLLLNGLSDRYLYRQQYVDTTLPFPLLRERALINDLLEASAPDARFYDVIRQRLPNYN